MELIIAKQDLGLIWIAVGDLGRLALPGELRGVPSVVIEDLGGELFLLAFEAALELAP